MNKYYYFEGRIFETEEEVKKATQNYNNKRFDVVETDKSFDLFSKAFELAKEDCTCSDADAIEWAR